MFYIYFIFSKKIRHFLRKSKTTFVYGEYMAVGDIYCHQCGNATYHLSAAIILLGYNFLPLFAFTFSSVKISIS